MRLSTDESRDEEVALETIAAAAGVGITVYDTGHAYGLDHAERGHNERLLSRGLRRAGGDATARVVTKGGMARTPDGAWIPDGRAKAIRADCEESLVALDGVPIDLYLLHAPDPRTPWRTSVRALARLVDEGLVPRVGVSNVNRAQLDEALELVPVAAVQVALSPFEDTAVRGGVVERCTAAGIAVIAHSPLGGPRRAGRLARHEALVAVAKAHGASPAEMALAWLLGISHAVVAIPGARRPETARSAARAAELELGADERAALDRAFLGAVPARRRSTPRDADADVLLIMGIPGAGKSRVASEHVARGYARLNRDERGGTLRELALSLGEGLSSGVHRVVLDNTYLTRATRSHVIEVAERHGVATRCIWLDTPLAQAQVNLVARLLARFGRLPSPQELRAASKTEPGVMAPTSQMRAFRELEPPSTDEGFQSVERRIFTRATGAARRRSGVVVAAAAASGRDLKRALVDAYPTAPHLVHDWNPNGDSVRLETAADRVRAHVSGPVESALCSHPAGPPTCWCRPPLPGLLLDFARTHSVDLGRSIQIGSAPAHRTLAATFDARYVEL